MAKRTARGLPGFTRKNAFNTRSASLSISASEYCHVWLPVLPVFLRTQSILTTLKDKAVHVGDLDVGGERRDGQGDGVAAVDQLVLLISDSKM